MANTKGRVKPHYVSQCLSKPWEVKDRKLVFYDFVRRKLGITPSRRLFREDRKRDVLLERRLNDLIENPLTRASARDRLLAPGQVDLTDWETYRAVILVNAMQPLRMAAKEQKNDHHLRNLLSQNDAAIDAFACAFAQDRQLVRIGSNDPRHELFYPEAGMFAFITRDDGCITGWAQGFAVPITPQIAFACISKTALWDWLSDTCHTGHHLQAFSLVGSRADRVVLPPSLREAAKTDDAWLLKYRVDMEDYVRQLQRLRALYRDAVERHGAILERATDGTDRYRVTNGVAIPPPDTFIPDA